MSGTLFVVATPIGNLADITSRALEVLKDVDFVVCEDTRHSRILLDYYGLKPPTVSLPAFAEGQRAERIVQRLAAGESAALITDAGTPAISDPGEKLVAEALEAEVTVVPIPGPAAVTTALSVSGLPTGRFHFLGFLPRKGTDRRAILEEVSQLSATLILYESPRRIVETLDELIPLLGDRRACVARELTKTHEELLRGALSTVANTLRERPEVLGEVVLLVEGRTGAQRWTEEEVRKALKDGLSQGEKLKTLSVAVATRAGWSGGDVYRLGLALKEDSG
jgi:16S rRNA (cytidine1402-2'-O)-methyltransferase